MQGGHIEAVLQLREHHLRLACASKVIVVFLD